VTLNINKLINHSLTSQSNFQRPQPTAKRCIRHFCQRESLSCTQRTLNDSFDIYF